MTSTAEILWGQLQQAGVVSASMPASPKIHSPWYVRVMLGFSGWIAALFLLGFVVAGLQFVIESTIATITLGGFALAAAYAIFRSARNDFHEQFGLAVSFAGQALLLYGLIRIVDGHASAPWWAATGLQILVATVMPNFIQRLVAGYVAVNTFAIALIPMGAQLVIPALVTFVIAVIWLHEFHWQRWGSMVRPVGYGLTLALVQLKGQLLFGHSLHLSIYQRDEFQLLVPQWVAKLATGLLLIAVVGYLLSRGDESWTSRRMLVALLMANVIMAVSVEAPGIATGFIVILLGFSYSNSVLSGLGIAALLFYVSAYYYTLQATLLTKSEILAATGATLLLARWVALKWIFSQEASSHA